MHLKTQGSGPVRDKKDLFLHFASFYGGIHAIGMNATMLTHYAVIRWLVWTNEKVFSLHNKTQWLVTASATSTTPLPGHCLCPFRQISFLERPEQTKERESFLSALHQTLIEGEKKKGKTHFLSCTIIVLPGLDLSSLSLTGFTWDHGQVITVRGFTYTHSFAEVFVFYFLIFFLYFLSPCLTSHLRQDATVGVITGRHGNG